MHERKLPWHGRLAHAFAAKFRTGEAPMPPIAIWLVVALVPWVVLACGSRKSRAVGNGSEFAAARSAHPTKLIRKGPSPQEYQSEAPPRGVRVGEYASGPLMLKAWVSADPHDGKKHPAVVYVHGGFAFGADDWDDTAAYRDAGFVVVTPILRGENGNPGHFEFFYGEVDDVIAAGNAVAKLPYV